MIRNLFSLILCLFRVIEVDFLGDLVIQVVDLGF